MLCECSNDGSQAENLASLVMLHWRKPKPTVITSSREGFDAVQWLEELENGKKIEDVIYEWPKIARKVPIGANWQIKLNESVSRLFTTKLKFIYLMMRIALSSKDGDLLNLCLKIK